MRSQASRSSAVPSSSAQRSSATSPRPSGVWPNADAALERDRHAAGAEDLGEQRGAIGAGSRSDDRDLLRRDALLADQPRDLRGDELELRALAAALAAA